MAKRLTAEQKQAAKEYFNAEVGFDNYLGSVFVNETNTRFTLAGSSRSTPRALRWGWDVRAEMLAPFSVA